MKGVLPAAGDKPLVVAQRLEVVGLTDGRLAVIEAGGVVGYVAAVDVDATPPSAQRLMELGKAALRDAVAIVKLPVESRDNDIAVKGHIKAACAYALAARTVEPDLKLAKLATAACEAGDGKGEVATTNWNLPETSSDVPTGPGVAYVDRPVDVVDSAGKPLRTLSPGVAVDVERLDGAFAWVALTTGVVTIDLGDVWDTCELEPPSSTAPNGTPPSAGDAQQTTRLCTADAVLVAKAVAANTSRGRLPIAALAKTKPTANDAARAASSATGTLLLAHLKRAWALSDRQARRALGPQVAAAALEVDHWADVLTNLSPRARVDDDDKVQARRVWVCTSGPTLELRPAAELDEPAKANGCYEYQPVQSCSPSLEELKAHRKRQQKADNSDEKARQKMGLFRLSPERMMQPRESIYLHFMEGDYVADYGMTSVDKKFRYRLDLPALVPIERLQLWFDSRSGDRRVDFELGPSSASAKDLRGLDASIDFPEDDLWECSGGSDTDHDDHEGGS
jgi:hypothetical protein